MEGLNQIIDFIATIRYTIGTEGWLLGMSTFFASVVQIYRLDVVQKVLAFAAKWKYTRWLRYAVWENLSPLGKTLLVAIPSAAVAGIATFLTGAGWFATISSAVLAVLGAMGSKKFAKSVMRKGYTKRQYEALVADDVRNAPNLKVDQ